MDADRVAWQKTGLRRETTAGLSNKSPERCHFNLYGLE